MQSFATEMNKGGQFLGSVKKSVTPLRQMHGYRQYDEEVGDFSGPFRSFRDKEGRSGISFV